MKNQENPSYFQWKIKFVTGIDKDLEPEKIKIVTRCSLEQENTGVSHYENIITYFDNQSHAQTFSAAGTMDKPQRGSTTAGVLIRTDNVFSQGIMNKQPKTPMGVEIHITLQTDSESTFQKFEEIQNGPTGTRELAVEVSATTGGDLPITKQLSVRGTVESDPIPME